MKTKLKTCTGCGNDRPIWKNHEGGKFCKTCWALRKSPGEQTETFKRKALRPVAPKREALNQAYSLLRKAFLKKPENSTCRAKFMGCTGSREELSIHHSKGRNAYLLDVSTWIPLCLSCHRMVNDNHEVAEALGLSESRLTPKSS